MSKCQKYINCQEVKYLDQGGSLQKIMTQRGSHIMRSICHVKIYLKMCELHCVVLFVTLLSSPTVCPFDI